MQIAFLIDNKSEFKIRCAICIAQHDTKNNLTYDEADG